MTIKKFCDLLAWQAGHRLAIHIYTITKKFPPDEIFGLTNQMRRCAVSITSNIAEGFPKGTDKEKLRFWYIAKGSLAELQNQLLLSRDVGYISSEEFHKIAQQTILTYKILNGLMSSTKRRNYNYPYSNI